MTKSKLDGKARTWTGRLVAHDNYGTWIYCPKGTPEQDAAGAISHRSHDGLQLLPDDVGWVAWWWADPEWLGIDVINEGPRPTATGYEYLDLELDLWWRDGKFGLVDEDELTDALQSGRVDLEQATRARSVGQELLTRLNAEDPLLTRIGFERLSRWRAEHSN